jgi:hypothetical protein
MAAAIYSNTSRDKASEDKPHLGAASRQEPFDEILGDELRRRAAIAKADAATQAAYEEALRQRHAQVAAENEQRPQAMLMGADSPTTPSEVVGWSQINMVGDTGLEPVTSALSRRRSPS